MYFQLLKNDLSYHIDYKKLMKSVMNENEILRVRSDTRCQQLIWIKIPLGKSNWFLANCEIVLCGWAETKRNQWVTTYLWIIFFNLFYCYHWHTKIINIHNIENSLKIIEKINGYILTYIRITYLILSHKCRDKLLIILIWIDFHDHNANLSICIELLKIKFKIHWP